MDEYYSENSYSPTIAEISRSLSLAVGTVHKYLHRMNEAGSLSFGGRHIITPYIEELHGKFHASVSGDIACGSPTYAKQLHYKAFPIPTDYIGKCGNFHGAGEVNIILRKQSVARHQVKRRNWTKCPVAAT